MGGAIPEMEDERALDEATGWLIRLNEEPDDRKLRARFERWRQASPANARAWTETAHAYDLVGAAVEPGELPPATKTTDRPESRFRGRRVLAGAAVAMLAACLVMVVLPGMLLRLNADFTTGTAEQRSVRLADGSVVALAPDSAIGVSLTDQDRRVRILSGRAYFEVESNPDKPFHVQAQGVEITVVGTGFDVRLAQGGAVVAVRHGAVRVDYAAESTPGSQLLAMGDWISVTGSGQIARGRETAEQVGIWRNGQLVAVDRPIADVVDELRPYFKGAIVLVGSELARRRVTGVYDLRQPPEALRALGRAHGSVTVREVLPWLLVISGS